MNQWDEIKQEIENHPYELWIKFMEIFPCNRKKYFLKIPNIKKIEMLEGEQIEFIMISSKYIICSSTNDFWNRWNRFKKLRLFL